MRQAIGQLLVVVAGAHRVGLPLSYVRETMRPQPVESLRETLPFVLGVSIIRGTSVPVVDLGALLGRDGVAASFARFVTLDLGDRFVALALEAVEGVLELPDQTFSALPPLLHHAAFEAVRALSIADQKFLLVLEATKLVLDPSADVRAAVS